MKLQVQSLVALSKSASSLLSSILGFRSSSASVLVWTLTPKAPDRQEAGKEVVLGVKRAKAIQQKCAAVISELSYPVLFCVFWKWVRIFRLVFLCTRKRRNVLIWKRRLVVLRTLRGNYLINMPSNHYGLCSGIFNIRSASENTDYSLRLEKTVMTGHLHDPRQAFHTCSY